MQQAVCSVEFPSRSWRP